MFKFSLWLLLSFTLSIFGQDIALANQFCEAKVENKSEQTVQKRPQVGVGVVVVRDGRVMLGKRKGAHGAGDWSFAGGHLELGESVEECAKRELEEESGLIASSVTLGPWTEDVIENDKHYVTLFVIVNAFEGEPQLLEPNKCEGWHWFEWDELPSPLFKPIRSLIQKVGMASLKRLSEPSIKTSLSYSLYHGSQADNIEMLEPRKRYTPGEIPNSPAIYASDDPAFAAAHAFPWSSSEGIDLYYDHEDGDVKEHVVLEVPEHLLSRLEKPVFIYQVSSEKFESLNIPPYGHNYRSLEATKCIAKQRFDTVIEAIHYFGGTVKIKYDRAD